MNRVVLILNGPPGSGKDTLAKLLAERHLFTVCENKEPLHNIAIAIAGVSRDEWFARYANRDLKESPWDAINGLTQRELLIDISERMIKPKYGDNWLGLRSVRNVKAIAGDVVFSDGGFQAEIDELVKAVGDQLVLIRLHRDGFTFAGDSRGYIQSPYVQHDLHLVDGRPDLALRVILDVVQAAREAQWMHTYKQQPESTEAAA